MQDNWQHFLFSIVAQLFLPLMPLIAEVWITGKINDETYAIAVSMYTISIGISTKNLAMLGLSIAVALTFSSIFGYLVSGNSLSYPVATPALITICSFVVIHTVERYKRHVSQGELFIELGGKND